MCRTVLIGRSTVSSSQQGDTSDREGCGFYVTSVMGPINKRQETIGYVNRNSDNDGVSDSYSDSYM